MVKRYATYDLFFATMKFNNKRDNLPRLNIICVFFDNNLSRLLDHGTMMSRTYRDPFSSRKYQGNYFDLVLIFTPNYP